VLVAGGTYAERCKYPHWDQLWGSGLRAALAISSLSPGTELHTYAAAEWRDDIRASLEAFGVRGVLTPVEQGVSFDYLNPFYLLQHNGPSSAYLPPLVVEGAAVLRFGMVEGHAKVSGKRVVYDPQSPVVYDPQSKSSGDFAKNGSTAGDLALILAHHDLLHEDWREKYDTRDAAVRERIIELFDSKEGRPRVVILKDGLGGASVWLGDEAVRIPAYAPETYFRIGSGDVFAAAFARAWAENGAAPEEAAEYAARCLAYTVSGPRIPLPSDDGLLPTALAGDQPARVRVLGTDHLEVGALLLHTSTWLEELGSAATVEMFETGSPSKEPALVHVGMAWDAAAVGSLEESTKGSAHRVVYWPDAPANAAEWFPGSVVTSDYATALYRMLRGAVS
jgi:hypothetical protein